jgi:hypothetical protein
VQVICKYYAILCKGRELLRKSGPRTNALWILMDKLYSEKEELAGPVTSSLRDSCLWFHSELSTPVTGPDHSCWVRKGSVDRILSSVPNVPLEWLYLQWVSKNILFFCAWFQTMGFMHAC